MDKNILLITNYFPPEKGAAANRMYSLAEGLDHAGYKVSVVCPLPNYPEGKIFKTFKGKVFKKEKTTHGKISRLWIWPNNSSNKVIRLLSMFSFSFSLVLFFIFTKTPKRIFIQYSPVFVGFTAVFLGWLFSKKIILNASDLWPLAGLEMGILKKGWYYSLLLKMERFCYRKADLIVGQSNEIISHVLDFDKDKPIFLYRNLPNFKPTIAAERLDKNEIKIVYAGLLGIAQGLFKICSEIKLPNNISLHIYGAGPEAEKIQNLQSDRIVFHGELDRGTLHKVLQKYDIAFIPLLKRIYGSVPSKIFEFTRLGLPVLYFAGGEGARIVECENLGWVIPVNNKELLQEFLNKLSFQTLDKFPREKVQQNSMKAFDFNEQFQAFIKLINSVQ